MTKFFSYIFVSLLISACSDASKKTESNDQNAILEYESVLVDNNSVDNIFKVESIEFGNAINFISRAGVVNLLETVLEDASATGYVVIEKAYKFGNKYILIISTGENGASCPATSYAFAFDLKSEMVTGKSPIDGCSEVVESFADGNKLLVKKDGAPLSIVNGNI